MFFASSSFWLKVVTLRVTLNDTCNAALGKLFSLVKFLDNQYFLPWLYWMA
jgi:hypothetical protein